MSIRVGGGVVDRLLLEAALCRAAQHETQLPLLGHAQLAFHVIAEHLPAAGIFQLCTPPLPFAARCGHHIPALLLLQPGYVLLARQPTVHHPDALGLAVAALDRFNDVLERLDLRHVAGEHLVPQRDPLARDDHGDVHLLAVGTMVPAVAALGQRVIRLLALEVGAGPIVERRDSYFVQEGALRGGAADAAPRPPCAAAVCPRLDTAARR